MRGRASETTWRLQRGRSVCKLRTSPNNTQALSQSDRRISAYGHRKAGQPPSAMGEVTLWGSGGAGRFFRARIFLGITAVGLSVLGVHGDPAARGACAAW